jgi:putative tryptophan/tyrosine transport system substrate-binding protein
MNFGFSILDFRLESQAMTKTSRTAILWFRSDNRKPVVSSVEPSAIQNPKWLGLSIIAFVLVLSGAMAQAQPTKIPRIGFLLAPSRSVLLERVDAFRQGLRELGYVEGQNIVIEYRYAEGKFDRLPDLATDLARLKVDVIVAAGGIQAIRAAKNATNTTPIIMTGTLDPVGDALIASFARPGGSITGLSLGGPELYGKRLELLKETVPKISRVAVFWYRTTPAVPSYLKEMHASAQPLGLQIQPLEVRTPSDFEAVFDAAAKGGARAFTVTTHPIFTGNRNPLLDFAAKNRLAAIYPWSEYVEDGGLMSYGPKLSDLYRRAATYVDKILKGAKPAELPVEQPTKFELIINLKAAKQIGLTIQPNVLALANKVIR